MNRVREHDQYIYCKPETISPVHNACPQSNLASSDAENKRKLMFQLQNQDTEKLFVCYKKHTKAHCDAEAASDPGLKHLPLERD